MSISRFINSIVYKISDIPSSKIPFNQRILLCLNLHFISNETTKTSGCGCKYLSISSTWETMTWATKYYALLLITNN